MLLGLLLGMIAGMLIASYYNKFTIEELELKIAILNGKYRMYKANYSRLLEQKKLYFKNK